MSEKNAEILENLKNEFKESDELAILDVAILDRMKLNKTNWILLEEFENLKVEKDDEEEKEVD